MRARPNAPSRRVDGSSIDGAATSKQEGATTLFDEKSGQKFKRPPRTAFMLLPPPPKMAASLMGNVSAKNDFKSTDKRIDDPTIGEVKSYEHDNNDALTNGTATAIPAIPIPLPPTSASAVHQRVNRKLHMGDGDPDAAATNAITSSGNNHATSTAKSYASDSYSNSHQVLRYHPYSNNSHFSHPYQPSSWYEKARNTQRKQQLAKKVLCAVIAIFISVLVWMGLQQLKSHDLAATKRHFKNYHHHDQRNHHFHPMLGIVESPLGFAKEVSSTTKQKRSYRQLEQQSEEANDMHDLFSTFPVVTLNNNRFLPCVGFGVSSRSVEHKQIPSIVSTLLNYASSETEGGGGIAMIDAVMDESRISGSNPDLQRYDEEEAALESSLANTVVTIVGRSIMFFGKERIKSHTRGIDSTASAVSTDIPFDYNNRLEVHLLVGLSDPDLGIDNTILALQHFVAELDGIVPQLPTDMLQIDPAEWKIPTSPTTADHRVDVRLHVLISVKGCQDRQHNRVPCSSDEDTNRELLRKVIESYALLENLYTANIIQGIGLDGMHADDILYLLRNSKIRPQLYRGDVSQAFGISSHRRLQQANKAEENIATIMKEHDITFLASNVAGHILERSTITPNAYALLQNLGGVIYRAHLEGVQHGIKRHQDGQEQYYTVLRLVLSYLVRQGICVLPHAYKAEHLADDAPESVGGLAKFLSDRRVAEIGAALTALVSGNDLPEDHGLGREDENKVAVGFHNQMADEVLVTRDGNAEEEGPTHQELGWTVKSGDSVLVIANTGDSFVAYGYDGRKQGSYTVNAEGGGAVDYTILP